jgi:hypothetical protein
MRWKVLIKGVCAIIIANTLGYDVTTLEWWAIYVSIGVLANIDTIV